MSSPTRVTTMPSNNLARQLEQIGLCAVPAGLDDFLARATKQRWSPHQILEHLAQTEATERAHRSLEILIAAATAALALPFLRACLRAFNPTSAIGKLDSQRTRWLESIKPTTEKTGQG